MNNNLKGLPTALQLRYHECPADDIHFGGTKGGGKTHTLSDEAFIECMNVPKLRAALFRRTLQELNETLLKEAFDNYPPHLYKYYSAKRKMIFVNGSVINFNYIETDKDLLQYQGQEYDFIGFDEAGNHNEHHLNVLYGCLRTNKKNYRTKWRVNSNPIGIGKGYLLRRFVKGREPFKLYYTPETAGLPKEHRRTMCFIPAKIGDNPHLLEKNPAYYNQLKLLPLEMQKALIDGDYESRAGAIFSNFSEAIHKEWEDYKPKAEDTLFIAMDWGNVKPFSVGWYAIDKFGTEHRYRELYGCAGQNPDVGLNLTIEEFGEMLLPMCGHEVYKFMVVDYGIDEKKGYEETIYEKLTKIMLKINVPVIKCHKNRKQGVANIQTKLLINPITQKPRLLISPSCKYMLMQLNDVIYNKDGTDLEPGQIEHTIDELIYFENTRPAFTVLENNIQFPPGSIGSKIEALIKSDKEDSERN